MPPELACCAALETESFTAVDSKFFFTAAFILRAALSASPRSTFTPNQLFSLRKVDLPSLCSQVIKMEYRDLRTFEGTISFFLFIIFLFGRHY